MTSAFFRLAPGRDVQSEEYLPQSPAGSGWGSEHMRGMAVSGALARATEKTVEELGRQDLQPVRWTLDLFRPAGMKPSFTSTTVVREGRRLCLVDAVLTQDGEAVARASALYLSPTSTPEGIVWASGNSPQPPHEDCRRSAGGAERLYYSESAGWTPPADAPQNGDRKQIWQFAIPVVEGEPLTAFQMAASVADAANVVSNLGSSGLEYINADVTLALARLPEGLELGLAALDRSEQHGISVGTGLVFDRVGVVGSVTVSAVGNARRAVDLRMFGHGDDARSQPKSGAAT
ncbi:acyl-CoA thioesterase domain-containing protein [Rhodococcus sp. JS3073]|uniref:acyl-CoA thioesterase domain-containing protein n=1 Tax=Rhodococcus sp. JS3073 TaxID=3002901 RepID=UPI0022868141|nr:acyl-CoA thioesterase domain-containing protein [Rhodococcus sp. JS3073]WAM12325.1 thioesterase family protein [Rhodococcus sp. JS3073]